MDQEPAATQPTAYGSPPIIPAVEQPPADLGDVAANKALGVRAEIEAYLEEDPSRLGEVHRGLKRGLSADEIAAELGVSTANFVWNYSRLIEALVEGDLPTAPTVALTAARRFRALLKLGRWSPAAREELVARLAELENRAEDEGARAAEDLTAKELTEEAESRNEVGIYVYALPHYIRYPFEPKSGRTLMKVGRSDSDVIQRFKNQTRTTALPEEPVLLRIYATQDAATAERKFHSTLEAADHDRSVARTAGKEWFVTSTKFLDALASLMDLPVQVINSSDVVEDL